MTWRRRRRRRRRLPSRGAGGAGLGRAASGPTLPIPTPPSRSTTTRSTGVASERASPRLWRQPQPSGLSTEKRCSEGCFRVKISRMSGGSGAGRLQRLISGIRGMHAPPTLHEPNATLSAREGGCVRLLEDWGSECRKEQVVALPLFCASSFPVSRAFFVPARNRGRGVERLIRQLQRSRANVGSTYVIVWLEEEEEEEEERRRYVRSKTQRCDMSTCESFNESYALIGGA
jgi:hypothetical protein